jgi:hypothetical protein
MNEHGPDFDELVGDDLDAPERARLRRVHEALVAAGPPPELPAQLVDAPTTALEPVRLPSRRRRVAILALAAALGALVFAGGLVVGNRGETPSPVRVVALSGTALAEQARASLDVYNADDAGNWPMNLSVQGLLPSVSGRPYELWLTRQGKPSALCGSFLAEEDGSTVVPMNAPYRLTEYDGWVVVEEGSKTPLLVTASV